MTGVVYFGQRTETGEDAYLVLEQLGEAARAESGLRGWQTRFRAAATATTTA
jgi:hypothetical protein